MTAQEKVDLAVLQEQMRHVTDNVAEVKDDVKAILDGLAALDKKYVTRDEFNLGKWVIGTSVVALGVMITLFATLRAWLKI